MIEVNNCFGKGYGWICALNRWSVQERAQTSLPYSLSGIALIAMKTLQADSCFNSDQIDTLFISVGGHFGPEAHNLHVYVRILFLRLLGEL